MKESVRQLLLGSKKSAKRVVKRYRHYRTDCYVISYPKCGRTWLRVMLAKALAVYYAIPLETVLDPSDVIKAGCRNAPRIGFRHDGADRSLSSQKQEDNSKYERYRNKKIVFLTRDPRDVIVSYFFHRTRRMKEHHDLNDFIKDPSFGIDRITSFMNDWYAHKDIPKGFLLLRYEDLHRDPEGELRKVLGFVGLADVPGEVIGQAVYYASFDNMRRISLAEGSTVNRIKPTDPSDLESHKMRKGKVGEYGNYLNPSEIEYVDKRLADNLSPVFGYSR